MVQMQLTVPSMRVVGCCSPAVRGSVIVLLHTHLRSPLLGVDDRCERPAFDWPVNSLPCSSGGNDSSLKVRSVLAELGTVA